MAGDDTTDLPPPPVATETDVRSFPFTPMFRGRLFGSSFHARASDSGWRAGVTLWLKSWDQVPAGSLPDDEIDLCRLAELGRDVKSWRKVKAEALWGWFKCSDGRLYHHVVAEGVNEAWTSKLAQRERTEKARSTKAERRLSQAGERVTDGVVTAEKPPPKKPVTTSVTETVTASNRTELNKEERRLSSSLDDPETLRFCAALGVDLGENQKRLNWPGIILKAKGEGLDFQRHILPGAAEARTRGKASIEYALSVARTKRDAEAAASSVEFENTDDSGWRKRVAAFLKVSAWPKEWGGTGPGTDPRHPAWMREKYAATQKVSP